MLDNTYVKQIKINLITEQRLGNTKHKLDDSKNITNDKTYNLLFAKGMLSIVLTFLIISVIIIYIPLLSVFSSIAPGLILSGGLLVGTGILFGKNITITPMEKDTNYKPPVNLNDNKYKVKKVSKDKIKSPIPFDNYNMQNDKDDKLKTYSMLR